MNTQKKTRGPLKINVHEDITVQDFVVTKIKNFLIKNFFALVAVIVAIMVVNFGDFLFESELLKSVVGVGLSVLILVLGGMAMKVLSREG